MYSIPIASFVSSALRQMAGRADEWHRASDGERLGLRLYHLSTCPYCLRVRATMARLGLEIPLRNIQISSRNRKELLNGGGRKTVPCLRIEDANGNVQWMYESGDIIAYLQRKFGSA